MADDPKQKPKADQPGSNSAASDAVGYKKPPKASQFKKGQSGNPRGRPKISVMKEDTGVTQMRNSIIDILERDVTIVIDGKKRKVKAIEAIQHRIIHAALTGNFKAQKYAAELYKGLVGDREEVRLDILKELIRIDVDDGITQGELMLKYMRGSDVFEARKEYEISEGLRPSRMKQPTNVPEHWLEKGKKKKS